MIRPTILAFLCLGLANAAAEAEPFSGARVEATLGYDRLSIHDAYEDLPDALTGARLGGAIGYDLAVGPRVTLGIEASAGWTLGARKTTMFARDRLREDLGRDIDVSARIGLRLASRTMG